MEPSLSSVSLSGVPLSAVKVKVTSPTDWLAGVMVAFRGSSGSAVILAMLSSLLVHWPEVAVGALPPVPVSVAVRVGQYSSPRDSSVTPSLSAVTVTLSTFT